MNKAFFARRFLAAACVAFAVLVAVEILKGHATPAALGFAATWAVITAAVYVAALAYRLRKGAACRRHAAGSDQRDPAWKG